MRRPDRGLGPRRGEDHPRLAHHDDMPQRPSPLNMPRRAPTKSTSSALASFAPELVRQFHDLGLPFDEDVAAEALRPVPLLSLLNAQGGAGLVGPAWRHVMNEGSYPLLALAVLAELLKRIQQIRLEASPSYASSTTGPWP